MKYFQFDKLLLREGWLTPGYIGVDDHGVVGYLSELAPADGIAIESVPGYALPGFLNAHSHAFQYAMAGLAEKHEPGAQDDFWSWREAMYKCALNMDPDQMEAIATMLYVSLLRNGYTHVAEFHYLHHDRNGKKYDNYSEMGERLIGAAATAGIKITLVPVFYQKGNFGTDAYPEQKRFICADPDEYLQLLDDTAQAIGKSRNATLGFGVHSLRAVHHTDVVRVFEQGPPSLPFHLHAAEQLKEVKDCEAYLNSRPVQWLIDNLPLNERFNIVHCTHLVEAEVAGLAASGANVILCPGTEGNLGDGIFRLSEYRRMGGNFCIGTDSHISLNPLEDLRWLDYSQRLLSHKRNTFDDGAKSMASMIHASGRKAMGMYQPVNYFATGIPFDAVVYNSKSPLLMPERTHDPLPSIFYTSDSSAIYGTIVNGKWVIKHGEHEQFDSVVTIYGNAIRSLDM